MAKTQREKRMLVALGVVVVVALLMVGFIMVRSGGSDQDVASPQVGARPQAPVTDPSPEPSPETSVPPLVFRGVDPFRPLVSKKRDSGEATQAAPQQQQPVPEGPASAVVGGSTVTLIDIFEKNGNQRAHVDVDGIVYAAGAGDNFVGDYVLVAFDDPCVQFAWRDQSFRLCVQPGTGG